MHKKKFVEPKWKMPYPLCNARTQTGQPCKHRTCKYAPKCMHHTKVRVGPSTLAAGRGLFAKSNIPANETIADYTVGTKALTPAQFLNAHPSGRATHVWRHPNGVYYDARDLTKSVAGAANRANRGARNNARITGGGKLKMRRAVRAGTEILTSYGQGFRI